MNESDIWNDEEPIAERFEGIEVPRWIESDISPSTVAAIVQGGCDSGAYMPAVTYHEARETMNEYGDAIFDYLEETTGELLTPVLDGLSWDGMACWYVSRAVELWASGAYSVLEDFEPEEEEEEVA